MALQFLRRTLISLSRKNEPSNFINPVIIILHFPLSSSSFSTLVTPTEIKDYFITHHKFSPETAFKASTLFDFTSDFKKTELILDYFKNRGFSNTQLEELVLCDPNVLAVDFNRFIKPRVEMLLDLGFTDVELATLLSSVPGVLTVIRPVDALASVISVVQNVLGSNEDVIRLLRTCNWFLCSDSNNILLPNIKLLEECGVSKMQIKRTMLSFSRFFLIQPEFMRECIRRADEMGSSRKSKMYIHGLRVLSSMSMKIWNSKLKLLRDMGFSENDIMFVFRTRPNVLAVSERKLLEVWKLLLSSELLGMDASYLIHHADLLVYSASTRIKPRLEILNALMSKGFLTTVPKMTTVCRMTDVNFVQKFVLPYANEIGEKCIASTGHREVVEKIRKNQQICDSFDE